MYVRVEGRFGCGRRVVIEVREFYSVFRVIVFVEVVFVFVGLVVEGDIICVGVVELGVECFVCIFDCCGVV